MPKSKLIGLSLGFISTLAAVLMLLVYLWHEKDHEHTDYTPMVEMITVCVLSICLTVWAVWRNLTDGHRAESLEAKNANIEYEFRTKLAQQEARADKAGEAARKAAAEQQIWQDQALKCKDEREGLRYLVEQQIVKIYKLESDLKSNNNLQPIVFGDAIQLGSKTISWWHIPIKATREMRGCTVSGHCDGRPFDLSWRIRQDPLVRRTDLYPEAWVLIPLVARSDKDGGEKSGGAPYPFLLAQGKARITSIETGQHPENIAHMPYAALAAETCVVAIKIRTASDPQAAPTTQVYELYIPPEDQGNAGFYLRHWDDFRA
jgi:hypothetical protein